MRDSKEADNPVRSRLAPRLLMILPGMTLICFFATPMPAQDDSDVAPRVHQNAVDQSQVRAQLDKADGDFADLIDQFNRNGLGDSRDVTVLRAVRASLASLSRQQMAQVLQLLDQAGKSRDDNAVKSNLTEAYAQQRDLASQMQRILISFQEQADLMDLSAQFMRLANQQNDNFKATRRLANTIKDYDRLNEAQQDELSVRRIEQDSITQEVSARLDRLPELMKTADEPTATRLESAMQQVPAGAIRGALESALSSLTRGFLYKGAAAELNSYRELREFARLLKPARDPGQIINDSAETLAHSIDTSNATDTQLAQAPPADNVVAEKLVDVQSDTSDDDTDVGKDVAQLSPKASATLAEAKALAAQATEQTAAKSFQTAANTEQQVIAKLALARQELLESNPTLPKPQQASDEGDPKDNKPGNHGDSNGGIANVAGSAAFINLPKADRDVVRQTQSERLPAEYSDKIQQYLANLADDSDNQTGGHN